MAYTNYRNLISKSEGQLEKLRAKLDNLKSEGRTREWTQQQTQAATKEAREALAALHRQRELQLIQDTAAAREIKRPGSYSERSYHLQKAATLAQGLAGEQLTRLFEQATLDPEARANWREYAEVIEPRLTDPALNAKLQELARKLETPEETEQRKDRQALQALEKHLQMIAGLELEAVQELAEGKNPAISITEAFNACLDNVQAHREGGPSSSYIADLEKRAGAE